jgi:hypothetical protein
MERRPAPTNHSGMLILIMRSNSMIIIDKQLKKKLAGGLWLLAAVAGFLAQSASGEESGKPARCAAPPYREFDFWVGDWDAFDVDKPNEVVARTRVMRILDSCVLLELYEGVDGHVGQSFTIYDASRHVWHQTWVTNQGGLLTIEGAIEKGQMILSGADRAKDGARRLVRGVWKPPEGGVRVTADRSTDGGKTWSPWFDLVFRPHKT